MKKYLNNPKIMAIASVVLLAIAVVYGMIENELYVFRMIPKLFDTDQLNIFILYEMAHLFIQVIIIVYFCLIILKKKINLNLFNILILFGLIITLGLYNNSYIDYRSIFSFISVDDKVIITFMIIFLGYTLIYKAKKEKMINILSIIGLILVVVNIFYPFTSHYYYNIIYSLYYVPLILYFRLYGISFIEKEVEKHE